MYVTKNYLADTKYNLLSHHAVGQSFHSRRKTGIQLSLYSMASSAVSQPLKGYDHQFIDQPPDDLLCLICLSVARDPQQITPCCGKVFCKVCLEELKKHSNDCPQCRKPMVCFPDIKSMLVVNVEISQLLL